MYDQVLAHRILEVLAMAFPEQLNLADLKKHLPEYSALDQRQWFLALEALNKEN